MQYNTALYMYCPVQLCRGFCTIIVLIIIVVICCLANDIIDRALERLNIPFENRGFDTEADMVGNLSAIIAALPRDNSFHGPIAGKYISPTLVLFMTTKAILLGNILLVGSWVQLIDCKRVFNILG